MATRKARTIGIATLSALALAFQGCGEDETAYCVDEFDSVTDNQNCYDDEAGGSGDGGSRGFLWVFGGSYGGKLKKGTVIKGGQKILASNRAALQSRGGFGSSARSSGFGRVSAGG